MSNVIIDKSKIDILANAISCKSGEPVTMTLDEMVSAVDGIDTSGGGSTPTGNIDITSAGVTDVTNYATATVPQGEMFASVTSAYYTENNQRKWRYRGVAQIATGDDYGTPGYIEDNTIEYSDWQIHNAIASGTSVTPTESSQTIGAAQTMLEGAVTVNAIPSNYVGSGITQRSSTDLSANGATVTAPSGYYASSASKSVASGSATPASSISATGATVSTGTNTLTLSKSVSNTPQVSAGYISSGTAGNSSVSLTASVTTKGATNHYATTSDQTIASGTYLTGTQTIKALSQTNLSAENIKSGTTVTINNGNANVWSVTGTYSGGGTSKNTQVVQGTTRTNASSMTAVGAELTVSKTGTYDIYWSGMRSNTSSSYTWATQLYIDNTAYGSENTTWTNNIQNIHLTSVSLTANQKLRVRGRNTRGTSYYIYAPTLVIVEA